MKILAVIASMCLSAAAYCGTYSIVSLTWAGSATGGATMTVSGNTATYTLIGAAYAPRGPETGFLVVQGTLTWTLQWTPSYPGDPVPGGELGNMQAYGHEYISAAANYLPYIDGNCYSTIGDIFTNGEVFNNTNNLGHPLNSLGSLTDSTLNLAAGTGPFTEVSPGVYQGTVSYGINVASSLSATTPGYSGPILTVDGAGVNASVKLSLTSMMGQTL